MYVIAYSVSIKHYLSSYEINRRRNEAGSIGGADIGPLSNDLLSKEDRRVLSTFDGSLCVHDLCGAGGSNHD